MGAGALCVGLDGCCIENKAKANKAKRTKPRKQSQENKAKRTKHREQSQENKAKRTKPRRCGEAKEAKSEKYRLVRVYRMMEWSSFLCVGMVRESCV
jgi:hypothetical protein